MSQYQPPTSTSASGGGGGTFAATGPNTYEDTSRPVKYACGECDAKIALKRGDPIRCKECGHRVLYKERTNRMVQFEAR